MDDDASITPPQDSGAPDPVETDPAALNSAEDLDEDRLRADPLESGMDPPERWSAASRHGMTATEQVEGRPLDDRLAEEQPDVPVPAPADPAPPDEAEAVLVNPDAEGGLEETRLQADLDVDDAILREASGRGQLADEAGGSVAGGVRTDHPS